MLKVCCCTFLFKCFFHSPSQSQPQPNRSRSTQSDGWEACCFQRHQGHLDLGGLACSSSCSTGPAGKPDVTACSRCSTCGHWGLLDDHPAASVALYWAEAQRPAPCVTPGGSARLQWPVLTFSKNSGYKSCDATLPPVFLTEHFVTISYRR